MAMMPLLILQCLMTPLSVWADTLQVQPEATDYSDGAASSSKDEGPVLNNEQHGAEVEQPTVADDDSPHPFLASLPPMQLIRRNPKMIDIHCIWLCFIPDSCTEYWLASSRFKWNDGRHYRSRKARRSPQDQSAFTGWQPFGERQHFGPIAHFRDRMGVSAGGQRADFWNSWTVASHRAIKLSLSGGLSDSYDIWYRVHSANVGWLGWASNGEPAGTQGYAYQIEAIQIKVLPKNAQDAPARGDAFRDHSQEPPTVSYRSHVSNVGWMGAVADGKTSGVIDSRNAIEALSLGVNWYGHGGFISSRAHVSGIVGKTGLQASSARRDSLDPLRPFSLS